MLKARKVEQFLKNHQKAVRLRAVVPSSIPTLRLRNAVNRGSVNFGTEALYRTDHIVILVYVLFNKKFWLI
jgi:hypothetical protein